jgi:drug/metabolite transporter (DMT)-like permease
MLAFAANSVLARLALSAGEMDALGYTGVRLASGALVLIGLIYLFGRRVRGQRLELSGTWRGAAALFAYALAFSVAYLMLGAGTGALILFASVQFGMLAWAVLKGDRPGFLEWLGITVAFCGLVFLINPGRTAPHPLGTALMVAAGFSWAAYSLLGRDSRSPLHDTAGNFILCLPVGIVLAMAGILTHAPSLQGLAYAITSGALASGLGYAVWYAALPSLSRTRAAIVQLTVPAIAAAGGVLLVAEPITGRLALSSAGILGGVALAIVAAEWRKSKVAFASRTDRLVGSTDSPERQA